MGWFLPIFGCENEGKKILFRPVICQMARGPGSPEGAELCRAGSITTTLEDLGLSEVGLYGAGLSEVPLPTSLCQGDVFFQLCG